MALELNLQFVCCKTTKLRHRNYNFHHWVKNHESKNKNEYMVICVIRKGTSFLPCMPAAQFPSQITKSGMAIEGFFHQLR